MIDPSPPHVPPVDDADVATVPVAPGPRSIATVAIEALVGEGRPEIVGVTLAGTAVRHRRPGSHP